MGTLFRIFAACALLSACGPSPSANDAMTGSSPSTPTSQPLASVDGSLWREVDSENPKHIVLASMCAMRFPDLEAAEPTLRAEVAMQLPWQIHVSRTGKLQAQCVWKGPNHRIGRIVIDVLCMKEDSQRCARFAYGMEGARRIEPVAIPHQPQLVIANTYPPGHDDDERKLSRDILDWTRDKGPDALGALRVEFRSVRVGINIDAKIPFVCGEIRRPGGSWHRFVVYSIGARALPPKPTYYWRSEPAGRNEVMDFCENKQGGLQWYTVPADRM